jgi:flagellar export protein FliJ
MPKFAFRLDALLRVRRTERDQHRRDLAAVLAEEEAIRGTRAAFAAELQSLADNSARAGAIDTAILLARENEVSRLRARLSKLELKQAELTARLTAQQAALAVAEAQVGALEKLRERRELEWRRTSAARELRDASAAVMHDRC